MKKQKNEVTRTRDVTGAELAKLLRRKYEIEAQMLATINKQIELVESRRLANKTYVP